MKARALRRGRTSKASAPKPVAAGGCLKPRPGRRFCSSMTFCRRDVSRGILKGESADSWSHRLRRDQFSVGVQVGRCPPSSLSMAMRSVTEVSAAPIIARLASKRNWQPSLLSSSSTATAGCVRSRPRSSFIRGFRATRHRDLQSSSKSEDVSARQPSARENLHSASPSAVITNAGESFDLRQMIDCVVGRLFGDQTSAAVSRRGRVAASPNSWASSIRKFVTGDSSIRRSAAVYGAGGRSRQRCSAVFSSAFLAERQRGQHRLQHVVAPAGATSMSSGVQRNGGRQVDPVLSVCWRDSE